MEFFANIGYGMITLVLCAVILSLLRVFQKNFPLINRIIGYCLIYFGIITVLIWGKTGVPLTADPAFRVGLVISILGAALLALSDTAKRG